MLGENFVGYVFEDQTKPWLAERSREALFQFNEKHVFCPNFRVVVESEPSSFRDGIAIFETMEETKAAIIVHNLKAIKHKPLLEWVIGANVAVIPINDKTVYAYIDGYSDLVGIALATHRNLFSTYQKINALEKRQNQSELVERQRQEEREKAQAYYFHITPIIKEIMDQGIRTKSGIIRELRRRQSKSFDLAPTMHNGDWYPKTLDTILNASPELRDGIEDGRESRWHL